MDPAEVGTQDELAACLQTLRKRRALSLADLEAGAGNLPRRRGFAPALARSTVSDMCAGKTIPSDETLRTFLAVCKVSPVDEPLWLAAAARARTAADRPRGAHRVRDSNPRSLGVHAAIEVPGAVGELPRYVPRDIDERLRAVLRSGAGFVLLVGSSSVGKTRCAYEALLAELPDWWLFYPLDVAQLDAFAASPTSRTVVWLDEIQRYLGNGLTASTIRALGNATHPVLVVGTLWPDTYHTFRTPPSPGVREDPFARQRELLSLATVLVVNPVLSAAERDRAIVAAATDPRLAATLTSSYGMTQALAAAPELIHRWEAAPDRHTWALIAAAADARRVGVRSPLSADVLRVAVPGYLTPTERAKAPVKWFETALGYATRELHGAAAVLEPVAVEMGVPTGYAIADYVYQHALRTRRTVVPPETAWTAYALHLPNAMDRLAAGEAAQDRKLHRHAERLYRSAGPDGLPALAYLQLVTERIDDAEQAWRAAIAATGDHNSRIWLSGMLERQDRLDEAEQVLRDAIAVDAVDTRSRLANLLATSGRADEAEQVLREGVARSDPEMWFSLARFLQEQDRLDEAEQVLLEAIAVEPPDERYSGGGPRYWLTDLLRDQGRHDDAEQVWRDGVAAGDPEAPYWLATQLMEDGRIDEAEQVWRDAVAADEPAAWYQLTWLLLDQGRTDEALSLWRDALAAGNPTAHTGMATVLEKLGRAAEAEQSWRNAIAAGEPNAHSELASFLENQDRNAEAEQLWRDTIATGEFDVFGGLEALLKKLGRTEEAHQIKRYGLNPDGSVVTPQPSE